MFSFLFCSYKYDTYFRYLNAKVIILADYSKILMIFLIQSDNEHQNRHL